VAVMMMPGGPGGVMTLCALAVMSDGWASRPLRNTSKTPAQRQLFDGDILLKTYNAVVFQEVKAIRNFCTNYLPNPLVFQERLFQPCQSVLLLSLFIYFFN
jgi:hypothetical protein